MLRSKYKILLTLTGCALLLDNDLFVAATPGDENFEKNTYVIFVPKVIRPGFDVGYSLSIYYKSCNNFKISARFNSRDGSIDLHSETYVKKCSSTKIRIGSVPIGYSGSTSFQLRVTAKCNDTGMDVFHTSSRDFLFCPKALSIFIETDKAIYHPGQTVRFRAACLKPDLRPLTGNVSIRVQDPNEHDVFIEDNQPLQLGVAGNQFSLPRESISGEWKITYIGQGFEETQQFTVRSFEPATFKVKLEAPSYFHPGLDGITIRMSALFNFGEPAKGHGAIYGNSVVFGQYLYRTVLAFEGSAEIFLSKEAIMRAHNWNGRTWKKIYFTGYLIESSSDKKISETIPVDLTPTKIKIEPLFKVNTIKPGLNYTAYAKVTEQDGKVLTEAERGTRRVIAIASYRKLYNTVDSENFVYEIPSDGIVKLTFRAKEGRYTGVNIKLYINDTINLVLCEWDAEKAQSPSRSFLQIIPTQTAFDPGDWAEITGVTTEADCQCKVLVIARDQIIHQGVANTMENERTHQYKFIIVHEMVPVIDIVMYYIRPNGEVVADKLRFTVSLQLKNQVSIDVPSNRLEPGEDISFRVRTSSPRSYVGVRAVDESVVLAWPDNRISTDRVLEDLYGYTTTTSRNPQSTKPGLSHRTSFIKDASDVLKKAGLSVLTNALVFKGGSSFDFYLKEGPLNQGLKGITSNNPPVSNEMDLHQLFAESSTQRTSLQTNDRSTFPETWMWKNKIAGQDGATTIDTNLPDSVTSWIVTSFSVCENIGLGVSQPRRITSFRRQKFFLSLNLPETIVRGVTTTVEVVVFNYNNIRLGVDLNLMVEGAIEVVRFTYVNPESSVPLQYEVQFSSSGNKQVRISATSQFGNDAIVRTVSVS